MTPIYQQAIKVILLLSDHLGEDAILEQAFTFHELAKALLLRSSMKESEAKMRTSIEPELLVIMWNSLLYSRASNFEILLPLRL